MVKMSPTGPDSRPETDSGNVLAEENTTREPVSYTHLTIREFHKVEVMVAPALLTEGKQLQRAQSIGMGS